MASTRVLVLVGVLLVALAISSEMIEARELEQTQEKNPMDGSYHGGGGYHGGCRYGCCKKGYYGRGCKCCSTPDEIPDAEFMPETHN